MFHFSSSGVRPRAWLLPLLVFGLLIAIRSSSQADAPSLTVNGQQFQDPNGNRVLLPGVGLSCAPALVNQGLPSGSQQIDYTPYNGTNFNTLLSYLESVAQLMTVRSPLYGQSHGWGTKVIRLGLSPGWFDSTGDGKNFSLGQLAAFVDNVVAPFCAYCQNLGIYVIIDTGYTTNADNLLNANNASAGVLYQIWDYISNPQNDNDPNNQGHPHAALRGSNVLYEIFNEPVYVGGYQDFFSIQTQGAWDTYRNLIQPVVDHIRSVDPNNNVCVIGGLFFAGFLNGAVSNPVTGGNIAYATHLYPNGAGFPSLNGPNSNNGPWQIQQNIEKSNNAIANQAPVLVTETNWFNYNDPNEQGRYAAVGNQPTYMGTSDAFGNIVLTWIDQHAQGATCWTYGEMLTPNFQVSATSLDSDAQDFGQPYFEWLWDAYDSENRGATTFPPVANGWYFMVSGVDPNMVLNEVGDSVTYPNPSACVLYTQTYTDNEQWHAIYQNNYGSNGTSAFRYEITTDVSQGWALGQQYDPIAGFAKVDVAVWDNQGNAQLWDLFGAGGDYYTLANDAFSGRQVMDDYGASNASNNIIDIWQANNAVNQNWQLQPTVPLH